MSWNGKIDVRGAFSSGLGILEIGYELTRVLVINEMTDYEA